MSAVTVAALEAPVDTDDTARITMSERAAQHVLKYAKAHGKPAAIRIGVRTSSCSAHAYTFELNDLYDADDYVCRSRQVTLIIDPKSLVFLAGTNIDYGREGLQEGFRFVNPNVKGTCGCGESFTV
jgi:iron-sulfur cluster assembly protein